MFWNRDKTVRVELVNPEIRLQTDHRHEPSTQAPQAESPAVRPNERLDFIFKLATLAAVSLQGALAIYGYSALTGNYEAFGISMSELEVGLPTLLFQGYLFILIDTVVPTAKLPLIGPVLTACFFMIIAGLISKWIKPTSNFGDLSSAAIILGGILFALFFMPAIGAQRGGDLALMDLIKSGLPPSLSMTSLDRLQVIPTDQGEKQGMLIAATTKYSFLLVGTEVLKIDNGGNKVVRVTKLSATDEQAETAKR